MNLSLILTVSGFSMWNMFSASFALRFCHPLLFPALLQRIVLPFYRSYRLSPGCSVFGWLVPGFGVNTCHLYVTAAITTLYMCN